MMTQTGRNRRGISIRAFKRGGRRRPAPAGRSRLILTTDWRKRNTLSLTGAARPCQAGAPPRSGFFDAYAGASVKIRTEPLDYWSGGEDKVQPSQEELARDPVFGA